MGLVRVTYYSYDFGGKRRFERQYNWLNVVVCQYYNCVN
jgi:hypothetical protein